MSDRGAVVVTGSSTGIGRACALGLERAGFRVFAGVRRPEDGEALRADSSGAIEPLLLDVTDQDQIEAAATRVHDASGGRLAGLVNNAGIAVGGPLEILPIEEFRRQLDVNLVGQVAVTQALLPQLRAARGRIVLMSSIGGRISLPFLWPYNASKWGLEAVGDALRVELRPFGVMVSIVEPGAIATPIWTKGDSSIKAMRERMSAEQERLYAPTLRRLATGTAEASAEGLPAERVVAVVEHALTSRRPRTRYLVGREAKLRARVRRLLPDRAWDALLARAMGL
jgi:NAD(P)-dependent dehydrogenase (short-subunit alcohol dehydrogenase family)